MYTQMPPEDERPYSCSDAMSAAGISRNALLNYERHGIVSPQRNASGYRTYTQGDLLDIMCCTMLLSLGYTVTEAVETLRSGDVLDLEPIDAYLHKLERQRDIAQAKHDNLLALRSVITEAQPPESAPITMVVCPSWLFFFDINPTKNPKKSSSADPRFSNQIQLMRSVPLSCRGFVVEGFFDGAPRHQWARTLRQAHQHLLEVDTTNAQVFGGPCLRAVVRATYPHLDPTGILLERLKTHLEQNDLKATGAPFVPLLFNNRRPSPVFELFIPVTSAEKNPTGDTPQNI